MDNPQDGDKIVKRELGEDGQPVVSETKVYNNGNWEDDGGGGSGFPTANITLVSNTDDSQFVSVYLSWYDEDLGTSVLNGLYEHDGIYDMGSSGYCEFEVLPHESVSLSVQLVSLPDPLRITLGQTSTATGDAVVAWDDSLEVYVASVTGNCTITIGENGGK
jgi:hypothetical protein